MSRKYVITKTKSKQYATLNMAHSVFYYYFCRWIRENVNLGRIIIACKAGLGVSKYLSRQICHEFEERQELK